VTSTRSAELASTDRHPAQFRKDENSYGCGVAQLGAADDDDRIRSGLDSTQMIGFA
jgi:hypothetical protein